MLSSCRRVCCVWVCCVCGYVWCVFTRLPAVRFFLPARFLLPSSVHGDAMRCASSVLFGLGWEVSCNDAHGYITDSFFLSMSPPPPRVYLPLLDLTRSCSGAPVVFYGTFYSSPPLPPFPSLFLPSSPLAPFHIPFLKVRETMTAAVELTADGFLQQINEYECIRDLGTGATAEVWYRVGVEPCPTPPLFFLQSLLCSLPRVRWPRACLCTPEGACHAASDVKVEHPGETTARLR